MRAQRRPGLGGPAHAGLSRLRHEPREPPAAQSSPQNSIRRQLTRTRTHPESAAAARQSRRNPSGALSRTQGRAGGDGSAAEPGPPQRAGRECRWPGPVGLRGPGAEPAVPVTSTGTCAPHPAASTHQQSTHHHPQKKSSRKDTPSPKWQENGSKSCKLKKKNKTNARKTGEGRKRTCWLTCAARHGGRRGGTWSGCLQRGAGGKKEGGGEKKQTLFLSLRDSAKASLPSAVSGEAPGPGLLNSSSSSRLPPPPSTAQLPAGPQRLIPARAWAPCPCPQISA